MSRDFKIPEKAKRVFKGVMFDIYQWKQDMFDGSTETFEALKRQDTANVIATKGDKILLAYEKQPLLVEAYTFFGGRIEDNEDSLAGAKREFKEESGMESNDWELFKTYEIMYPIEWRVYTFIARDCIKVAEIELEAGEIIVIREVGFDEFVNIASSEDFWGKEFSSDINRMKQEPKKLEEFRKLIFGNK
ncbi:MAG: NUDIX domain-containing protein [Parcubacteria group bacterium]